MKKTLRIGAILLLVASLVWSGYLTKNFYDLSKKIENSSGNTSTNTSVEKVVSEMDTDVTKVVDQIKDKVVSIVNIQRNQQAGSGSGVIYKNENGKVKIITNHHVINGAEKVMVRLADGEEVEAKVLGSDQYSDLALIEIEKEMDIEPFKLGDSSYAKVGEFVIAVGSPMGLEFANSVTFGIISGKDRAIPVDLDGNGSSDWDMVVLQTDAAINPGNSGGALVNMAGELVGINSMKLSSDQVEGMGFAIPVNEVVPIVEQLETKGSVKYPIIGVSAVAVADMHPYYRQSYKVPNDVTDGVFVAEVTNDGPARAAGLKEGDIITKFDGETISTFKDFRRKLFSRKVGDTVSLEINRNGTVQTIDVTLE